MSKKNRSQNKLSSEELSKVPGGNHKDSKNDLKRIIEEMKPFPDLSEEDLIKLTQR
ncbi:hypothetical protein [Legionella clemsonensis]|uniref:Uncharacterized protein n=1 Tax=Legionella clemsonensis TaxID=1867846 RepID=A0A222NZH6_9GAMM|nr:hypothetical protein [Legionella clemsonensis]ASQ44981.1 hypothetical protein clem_02090 [Legionella clemsonensis]